MPRHERTWFPFPMTIAYAAVAYVGLVVLSRAVLGGVGVGTPLPDGGRSLTNLVAWMLPAVALLAGALALLARGMSGGFPSRWASLFAYAWATSSLSVPLGMSALATADQVSPLRLVAWLAATTLVPSAAASAVAAATFVPGDAHRGFPRRFARWRATRASHQWAWRLPAGVLACAAALGLATFALGPLVGGGLALDGVLLQVLRGAVLALVALPIVVLWERAGSQLLATLAFAYAAPAMLGAWVLGAFLDRADRFVGLLEMVVTAAIVAGALVVLWLGRHADDEIDVLNDSELVPAL
jgi:hypothetical protein